MQIDVSYSEANKRKFPEQTAVIIAKDSEGKYNPVVVGWIMPVSMKPAMWAFSLAKGRHSLDAIRYAKTFTISFPSAAMAEAATFYGTHSGADTDKFAQHPVPTEEASAIDSLLLSDAVVNLECELEREEELGDCVLVVGKVVASHMNDDPSVGRLYVLDSSLNLGGVVPG